MLQTSTILAFAAPDKLQGANPEIRTYPSWLVLPPGVVFQATKYGRRHSPKRATYSFPRAAITKDRQFGGFKLWKCICSLFRRLEFPNQGVTMFIQGGNVIFK